MKPVRKRLRVVLDIDIEVHPITRERIDERLQYYGNYDEVKDDPWYDEMQVHQQALMEALVADPEKLGWLLKKFTIEAVTEGDFHTDLRIHRDEKDELQDLIQTLPEDSQEYFVEAQQANLWGEYVGAFYDAIKHELRSASIVEIDQSTDRPISAEE